MRATNLEDITPERLLSRSFFEQTENLDELLRNRNLTAARRHQLTLDCDVLALLEANAGVAIAPQSLTIPSILKRLPINDFPLTRTVYVYAVAGRPRTGPAATLVKQLSGADWSSFTI